MVKLFPSYSKTSTAIDFYFIEIDDLDICQYCCVIDTKEAVCHINVFLADRFQFVKH